MKHIELLETGMSKEGIKLVLLVIVDEILPEYFSEAEMTRLSLPW